MIDRFNKKNKEQMNEQSPFVPIVTEIHTTIDPEKESEASLTDIPVLALRNMVLFPNVTIPIAVGREKSLRLITEAQHTQAPIAVFCQKDPSVEDPTFADLNNVGVLAHVVKVLELPDNSTNVILQGRQRVQLDYITHTLPYLRGVVSPYPEKVPSDNDKEFMVLMSSVVETVNSMLNNVGDDGKEMYFALRNIDNPLFYLSFLASNFPFEPRFKQQLLDESSLKKRAYKLLQQLRTEAQLLEIRADIQSKTREDISQQQREHFLQQQIRTIQDELGTSYDDDIEELRARGEKKKWNPETAQTFEKELKKLERINPQSPDYSVQYNYLDSLLNLPWNEYTHDDFNLDKVEKQLNKDHYGLEQVKDRILEHIAVLKLREDMKSPILCLYGPPGVGKTSLGKSIANAMHRKYVRVSLGGLHDEAEIRGHRRTYIGALPGRILQGIIKAGSSNPVFMLDEIDKLGQDFKGDPSSALLEVLDPEQNSHFHDNFIDADYDLSKVFFIATANSLATLPQPLLDRLELIDVSGYILEEKVEIARKHLIPRQLEEHGFDKKEIDFPKKTLSLIISDYTRESGVRELEKKIAKILRRIARLKASNKEYPQKISEAEVREYLGPADYSTDHYEGNEDVGVVTGLAWTAVGGEILFIESSLSRGKGEKLTLTGNLGNVMKESAVIAMQYLKANSDAFGIDYRLFDCYNVHIHVPEGAIPKDGPSAGVTMVTSLASAFTRRKVRSNLAMTGEITLRGKVLPVGGIKEKILAAKRAGITDIMLCEENRKDIEVIKEKYLKGLTFHYVKTIKQVLDFALLDETVGAPLQVFDENDKNEN